MKYAICDLETTGLELNSQIIEIAILIVEDGKIVDSYQSLVNPLIKVSQEVLGLTKISSRNIDAAPKFYDIAPTLFQMLEGTTFVSHKTDFDYTILKEHFKSLDMDLSGKTFCTLKKSQDLIPGLASYSLDAMCAFFNIKIKERHRAWADALLCFEIFNHLLGLLTPKSFEHYLPYHKAILSSLSRGPGILFFKNKDDQILKAYSCIDVYEKACEMLTYRFLHREFLSQVASLETMLTRSELMAQIRLEQLFPKKHQWGIYLGEKKNGEKVLYPDKLREKSNLLWSDVSKKEVIKKMRLLNSSKNQDYVYTSMISKEVIVQRNIELLNTLKTIQFASSDLLISFEGTVRDEIDFLLIRGHSVRGKGTASKEIWDDVVKSPETYLNERWPYSPEINQITRNYLTSLKNNKYKKESLRVLSPRVFKKKKRESYESKEV